MMLRNEGDADEQSEGGIDIEAAESGSAQSQAGRQ